VLWQSFLESAITESLNWNFSYAKRDMKESLGTITFKLLLAFYNPSSVLWYCPTWQ